MKKPLLLILSLACISCSKTPPPTASGTPASSPPPAIATVTPQPTASATPHPLGDPELPSDAESFLVPLPSWTLADTETQPWWTSSGISDNSLRSFVSDLEPQEVEARLVPFLTADDRHPLPGTSGFFDAAGARLAVYAQEGSIYGVAALVSPPGQPPHAWEVLNLPALDWSNNQTALEGKKSLVVIFSGYGTTDYLLNRAQGYVDSSASATPEATADGSTEATASATPVP